MEEKVMSSKYDEYNGYFTQIKQLCIDAYKDDVITDEKYFIDHGIPEWFMKEIKKAHLFSGGKGHQNLYWNWTKNKKFPKATVSNFLDFIKDKEIKEGK